MLVHGVWTTDGLAFWAESTPADPTASGRTRPAGAPRPHPFAAPAPAIAAALGFDTPPTAEADAPPPTAGHTAKPRPPQGAAEPRVLELLLPGSAQEPLPSPETGRMAEVARPRLRLWQVPAVVPRAADALRVLTEHTGTTTGTTTATARHWAAVAAFAHDLVRRGRVIPQLVPLPAADHERAASDPDDAATAMWATPEANARAVWRPVLTGADAAYFRDLALAMPPACRTSSVERHSADVQHEALEAFTDAVVRRTLTGPLLSRPPRTLQERWLAALTGDGAACPDVPELRRELERWHEAVTTSEGATRVCFRLVEPPDGPRHQRGRRVAGGAGVAGR
ncbi:hypothetical protein ACFQQB_03915 [Nonomuraea rubra]|uniref:hypothetical protein n=1 Tax=Nonomuraea rubra TaxID=46180 RepID=UPI00360BC673